MDLCSYVQRLPTPEVHASLRCVLFVNFVNFVWESLYSWFYWFSLTFLASRKIHKNHKMARRFARACRLCRVLAFLTKEGLCKRARVKSELELLPRAPPKFNNGVVNKRIDKTRTYVLMSKKPKSADKFCTLPIFLYLCKLNERVRVRAHTYT